MPIEKNKKELTNPDNLNLLNRLYFVPFIKGLKVTAGHFWKNLFSWLSGKKGGVTSFYPEELRQDFSPINRGKFYLVMRKDGSPQCVACLMCQTVCPSKVINIEAEESENPKIQRRCRSFTIDVTRCIFCGFCVEACPVDAIRMDTNFNIAAFNKQELSYNKDFLLSWNFTITEKERGL